MDALLTAIVVWLSTNFGLPANFESPRIRFASSAELNFPLKGSVGSEAKKQTPTAEGSSDIVSFYSMESKTIYLADGWTGKTRRCPTHAAKWRKEPTPENRADQVTAMQNL
jgi:hypothetical protein